jgi:hypothetical protein
MKRSITVSALAIVLSLTAGFASSADPTPAGGEAKTPKQEPIFGNQMMTQQERADYQAKMHAAKTAEEREQIRKEHHASMAERAKARGVTLPAEPPVRGGMGPGGGMGPHGGMGPDGGMGPRGGMGPDSGMGPHGGIGPDGGMGPHGGMGQGPGSGR